MTLIANSIREQIQVFQKQAIERSGGFRAGEDFSLMKKSTRSLIENATLTGKKNLENTLITESNYLRSTGPADWYPYEGDELIRWEPRIEVLNPKDIDRIEKLEDRKIR